MNTHAIHRRASARTRALALAIAGALAASMLVASPAAGDGGIERLGSVALDEGQELRANARAAVSDGTHAYFGAVDSDDVFGPALVVKIKIDDLTRVGQLTLESGEALLSSAVQKDGFAYFGTNTEPGRIVKVDLDSFTRVGSLVLDNSATGFADNQGLDSPQAAFVAGNFAYFAGSTKSGGPGSTSGIVKVDLSDFTVADGLLLTVLDSDASTGLANFPSISAAVTDGTHGYFVGTGSRGNFPDTSPMIITKVKLDDMTRDPAPLNLSVAADLVPDERVTSGVTDGTHAYFGTDEGNVVKVRLSDLTFVSKIALSDSIDQVRVAAIDTAASGGPFAYFGGSGSGFTGQVVKVDLSSEPMVEGPATIMCPSEAITAGVLAGADLLVGVRVGGPSAIVRVGDGTRADCPGSGGTDEDPSGTTGSVTTGGGAVAGDSAVDVPVAAAVAAAQAAGVAGTSAAVLVRGGEVVPMTSGSASGIGPRGGVVLEAEGLTVSIAAVGGASPSTGVVTPVGGEIVCVVCAELAAGRTVEAWMYSTPQLVAAVRVPDDHEDGDCVLLRIPVGAPLEGSAIAAGPHTLQLRLPTSGGLEVVATGVTVGTAVPTSVPAGEGPAGRGLLGLFGLLAAAGAVVVVRRQAVIG